MTGVRTASKLTLAFINVLFVAVGVASMALGAWVLLYREGVRELTLLEAATSELGLLQNAVILLITAGIALFVLGFVGCCATYKNQQCLRILYIGLVSLCCVITIAASAVAFIFRDELEEKLLTHLESKLKTEYQGFTTSLLDFSQAWDYAQVECCGVTSYEDFQDARNWTVRNSATVPLSCCVMTDREAFLEERFYTLADKSCVQFPNSTNTYIDNPCYGELKDWMEQEATLTGGAAVVSTVLQIFGILFMVVLLRQKPKTDSRLYREV